MKVLAYLAYLGLLAYAAPTSPQEAEDDIKVYQLKGSVFDGRNRDDAMSFGGPRPEFACINTDSDEHPILFTIESGQPGFYSLRVWPHADDPEFIVLQASENRTDRTSPNDIVKTTNPTALERLFAWDTWSMADDGSLNVVPNPGIWLATRIGVDTWYIGTLPPGWGAGGSFKVTVRAIAVNSTVISD